MITIGKYTIEWLELYDIEKDEVICHKKLHIGEKGGEGGVFDAKQFEKAITEFYEKNF